MKDFIRKLIQNKFTDYLVAVLIIISVTLTVLEVQSPPGSYDRYIYGYIGFIITLVFVVELSLRWYISSSTKDFFKEYWIDVIAVIPTIRVLRIIRALRMLRIIRLGIIISRRSRKKAYLFGEGVRENLKIIFIIFNIFILGAIGMFLVENHNSSFDSFDKTIWWSLFTLMAGEPVGGEAQTLVGKFISAFVMLGGFTFFAVFTGIV
ncbi:MAG: ion transporter [Myxococcota bacterium]